MLEDIEERRKERKMPVKITKAERKILEQCKIDMTTKTFNSRNNLRVNNLAEVYDKGWWATELFGQQVYLTAERRYKGNILFNLSLRFIETTVPLNVVDDVIQRINNRQFRKYKNTMLAGCNK